MPVGVGAMGDWDTTEPVRCSNELIWQPCVVTGDGRPSHTGNHCILLHVVQADDRVDERIGAGLAGQQRLCDDEARIEGQPAQL